MKNPPDTRSIRGLHPTRLQRYRPARGTFVVGITDIPKSLACCMSSIFATSYTGFWIFGQAIHGSIGYTGYWLSEGHIYGPRGYTECWIDDEQHISSNTYGYIGWL